MSSPPDSSVEVDACSKTFSIPDNLYSERRPLSQGILKKQEPQLSNSQLRVLSFLVWNSDVGSAADSAFLHSPELIRDKCNCLSYVLEMN